MNLLAGIATSPFKLLGGMFGGGEEVNLIDFDPGSASLDAAGAEKLAALTKALRERPQLSLEVPALYAPDADFANLAAKHVEARLAVLAQSRQEPGALTDPVQRFELLLALYALLRAAHPLYSSTSTWHGGVGGQALTQGCSVKDPPPWHEEGVRRVKETLLKSMNKLDEPRMDRLDKAAHAMFPRK